MTTKTMLLSLSVLFFVSTETCFANTKNDFFPLSFDDTIPPVHRNVLVISVFNEAIIPSFSNVFKGPLHPGISIGRQRLLSPKIKSQWLWTYNIAFYHHKLVQNGIYLNTELAYGRRFGSFQAHVFAGIGYLHTLFPGKIYKYSNGAFQQRNDGGRGHLMPSLSLRTAYNLLNKNKRPLGFFIQYQFFLETPFAPNNDIPLLPHGAFHLGTTLPINF